MTKMKGLFKSIKNISQIFVVQKEQEMEIGYPTDVKHVAHIGWENSGSMNSPSWMNNFKSATEFTSNSPTKFGQSKFKDPTCVFQDYNVTDTPKASKKVKKKKKLNKSSTLNKSTM